MQLKQLLKKQHVLQLLKKKHHVFVQNESANAAALFVV
jgi:hypothetical protein